MTGSFIGKRPIRKVTVRNCTKMKIKMISDKSTARDSPITEKRSGKFIEKRPIVKETVRDCTNMKMIPSDGVDRDRLCFIF